MLTERITMQQKTHGGRITAFLLRSIHPLCEEHTDMYSLLSIAATASQWKKVYVGTVKVCTLALEAISSTFPFSSLSTCCCQFQTGLQLPLLLFLLVPAYAKTLLSI